MSKRVRDKEWMDKVLSEEELGHLALSDGGAPYIVPINYAYLDGKIVIHCATKGRKLNIIGQNPKCCFAVDRHPDKVRYHPEKRCHYRYHSVLVFGRATYIESAEERLEWIKRYKDYFDARLPWTVDAKEEFGIKTAEHCGIIIIDIDDMTGRKEEGADRDAHLARDK